MIETHVANALLLPDIKDGTPFKILTFINGLVAPSFLFCSGFAFAISLRRKWEDFTSFTKAFWRYVIRLLFILVVGYSLHLPFFSLKKLQELSDPAAWSPFYQTDILQTISVTLLLFTFLIAVLRSERFFLLSAGLIGATFVFAAPIVREMDLGNLPVWLQPYLTMKVKSQFPLFPWSGFLIAGLMVGYGYIRANGAERGDVFMNRLSLGAVAAIVLSLIVEVGPVTVYPNHDFWRASPEFFFVRVGIVLLLMYMLWWKDKRAAAPGQMFVALFGQESLIVYVTHLLIVYGYTYEFSFIRLFGPTLNYPTVFGLFAALTLAMFLLAYVWHAMKGWNKRISRYIQFAVLAGIVVAFLLKSG